MAAIVTAPGGPRVPFSRTRRLSTRPAKTGRNGSPKIGRLARARRQRAPGDTLRKQFGKRPNITNILTNDIGWGELGWQGGGRTIDKPTSNLDRLACEGMGIHMGYAYYNNDNGAVQLARHDQGRFSGTGGRNVFLEPGDENT